MAATLILARVKWRTAHEAERRARGLNRGQAKRAYAARRVDRQGRVARGASRRKKKVEQVMQHRSRFY
jgi:hypothetical protein